MFVLNEIKKYLLDLIFPPLCLNCRQEGCLICSKCLNQIKPALYPICFVCGKRKPDGQICQSCKKRSKTNLNGLFYPFDAEHRLIHQIIYEYKYKFVKDLSDTLAKILIRYLEKIYLTRLFSPRDIVVVPVPLHPKRWHWRGFNQAALLAEQIAEHFNLAIDCQMLSRQRHTTPQMQIENKAERINNIRGAFKISSQNSPLKGKIVILVDDISTSGATLEECAKTLKILKPKKIFGLVLARG